MRTGYQVALFSKTYSVPRKLKYFSAGTNQFSGSISYLEDAPKTMERLFVGDNNLSGPVYFANLPPNLTCVYLSRNVGLSGNVFVSTLPWGLQSGSLSVAGTGIRKY